MDISIRLFSDRLRRLLAGEEGTLLDAAAKQVILNFHAEIEIFTSLLSEYEIDMAWLLLQLFSEEKKTESPDLLAILEEIQSFAYESEKVIDTFLMSIMQHKSCESGSKDICDALPGLQSKIIDIKQRLQQVGQIHPLIEYDLLLKFFNNYQASSCYKNKDIVGLDERMEELLDLLIEGPPQLSLVALLDSAGVDKTALAAEAYNSNYVKHYFDCHAWVPVTFFSDSNHILDGIIKCVVPLFKLGEVMDKNLEMRKKFLIDFLMSKRYLIVVDDVWGEKEFDDIRDVLPDNQNGSRVVITISGTKILASFQLENGENIGLDLVPPGRTLRVTRNGWPFLILYHGGISFEENIGKTSAPLWLKAQQYSFLRFNLKICCFYLSVFPVYFEVSTRQLYQLWIAEGFIPDNNEATAEGYLEELINLGLVEAKRRKAGGTIKTCYVPGRWWIALLGLAYEVKFIYSRFVDTWLLASYSHENVKRFTAQMDVFEFDDLLGFDCRYLHSLLYLSSKISHLDPMKCEEICKTFKFLRVLDLGYLVLNQYPSGIENLFLLRYLKLNIPSLKSLPSSILCNLLNLYTLDLPSSYIDYIADDIWKLTKLRHLNFGLITLPAYLGKHCSSLENLNFISTLHPSCCTPDILGRLPNLQNLRLYGDLSYNQSLLSKSLCRLSCLESLKLVNASEAPWISKIALVEYEFPPSLTHLSLSNTELMDDPMPTLEKLPHLQVLKLKQNSYLGRKLACGSNGFPKLKVLHLKSMLWLEEWAMEIGSMPKLACLMINPCAYLKRIPEQLWYMKSFKKLELWWPQPELRQKVRDFEDMEQYDIQIYPLGM